MAGECNYMYRNKTAMNTPFDDMVATTLDSTVIHETVYDLAKRPFRTTLFDSTRLFECSIWYTRYGSCMRWTLIGPGVQESR